MSFRTSSLARAPLLLLAMMVPSLAFAQIGSNLSRYTEENARGYLNPLKEAYGAALQAGMYRSAAIPRIGPKVDFEVKVGLVTFGDADRSFTARAESGFSGATDTATAPTVVGEETTVTLDGYGGSQFVFPGGIDLDFVGLPVPQLTVSGFMGSQALLRWISFDIGDQDTDNIDLLGIGLRHSISQYIPACPVDVAAGVTWQSLKVGDDLITASALSFGAQASKRFAILEPYAGLAVDRFEMSVDYDYESGTETVPFHVDLGSSTNLHLSGGVGVNLGLLHFYGEVGTAGRMILSAGFGLGN